LTITLIIDRELKVSTIASKRFADELSLLLDRSVTVLTSSGTRVSGRLIAYNPTDYSLWLAEAQTSDGRTISKLFIAGKEISMIELVELGPDLQTLYERINRLFPNMARYYKEAGVILVMDRIRVTKDGVVEGTGPAAERVQKVWEEWKKEQEQTT